MLEIGLLLSAAIHRVPSVTGRLDVQISSRNIMSGRMYALIHMCESPQDGSFFAWRSMDKRIFIGEGTQGGGEVLERERWRENEVRVISLCTCAKRRVGANVHRMRKDQVSHGCCRGAQVGQDTERFQNGHLPKSLVRPAVPVCCVLSPGMAPHRRHQFAIRGRCIRMVRLSFGFWKTNETILHCITGNCCGRLLRGL